MSPLRTSVRSVAAAAWLAAAACPTQAHPAGAVRYLYYLHGKIVEDSGPRGVSPRFGAYDYPGIVAALAQPPVKVISEARKRDTDPVDYADKVVAQVRAQVARGVPPSHITIAGASKGSVIAALVSSKLQIPGVRYVLMANCNDWLIRTYHPHLSGEVLSVYEASDDVGGSCAPLVHQSPKVTRFREIRLNTGLGHGIVYRPLDLWAKPAIAWAKR